MKNKFLVLILSLLLALSFSLTACGGGNGGNNGNNDGGDTNISPVAPTPDKFDEKTAYNVNYYDNIDFNEFYKGEDVSIKEQWADYGMGDPYVMRWNGMYYVYVSTENYSIGVRAWKSKDLVNWTPCQGEGLQKGYVCYDMSVGEGAYAPEVIYWNGTFYMYSSIGGRGHRILTATSPEGPFVAANETNYGLNIDGSVFIDDDETMYFLYANSGGVRSYTLSDPLTFDGRSSAITNTSIGGWTEGPGLIKRDGVYYLTYTGTNVISDAYKVGYSVSTTGLSDPGSWNYGDNKTLLLDSDYDVAKGDYGKGTGHSSTVLGPDLDSYYIAYHTLNAVAGPNRSMAIDRLLFNGAQMTTVPTDSEAIAPALPQFATESFEKGFADGVFTSENGVKLSKATTGNSFSAEFNFKGDNTKCLVGYTDSENYVYVQTDLANKKITLTKVANGTAQTVKEGTLTNAFDANVVHTVRVAYKNGKMDVYFDNMCKIDDADVNCGAGKIGYDGASEIYFTAFSNVAMGDSDKIEAKQSKATIGAVTYDESKSSLKNSKIVNVDSEPVANNMYYANAKQLNLAKDDYASYKVKFANTGLYGLVMTYPVTMMGKQIGVRADDREVYKVTLPNVNVDTDEDSFVTALVTEFEVLRKISMISLHGLESEVSFISFKLEETSRWTPDYSNDLSKPVTKGATYVTTWKVRNDGQKDAHFIKANTRNLVYFGDSRFTDASVEVSIKYTYESSSQSSGIVLRAKNYSASSVDTYTSIQAYYVYMKCVNGGVGEVGLAKLNHNNSNLTAKVVGGIEGIKVGTYNKLKAVIKGNEIKVYLNGKEMFTYVDADPFVTGNIGLYNNGAESYFKDLSIKGA